MRGGHATHICAQTDYARLYISVILNERKKINKENDYCEKTLAMLLHSPRKVESASLPTWPLPVLLSMNRPTSSEYMLIGRPANFKMTSCQVHCHIDIITCTRSITKKLLNLCRRQQVGGRPAKGRPHTVHSPPACNN